MGIHISGLILFYIVSCIMGIIVSVILWRYPRENNDHNKLLSASFLFLSLGQAIGVLVQTKLILSVPHLYRLGNLFALMVMPLSWMYMRMLLKNKKLNSKDLVHVLPALIFFLDYSPFFFSNADSKRLSIAEHFNNLSLVLKYQESWVFPDWFHLWFRNVLILFYWVLEVRLLINVYRSKTKEFITENRSWITWLSIYVSLQFFFFAPFFAAAVYSSLPYWTTMMTGASVFLAFAGISLIYQPVILYGIRGWIFHEGSDGNSAREPEHAAIIYMSKEKLRRINDQLEELMVNEKPYLKAGYSLVDLTNDLGIPLYQVSYFLNHTKGKTFHDLLNEYRISYSKEVMIKENHRQLTLEAIAYEAGFGNRNSFTNAFKKFTGQTPSAFMKEVKNVRSNKS